MSCTPNPQVLSPCQDDAVAVGQSLGVTGDIAFDEQGSLALVPGQTEVGISFNYEKASDDYRFEHLYIQVNEEEPEDIRPVPKKRTTLGFTASLTGEIISENAVLYWRVVVPDQLRECQTAQGGPQYIILPPSQEGRTLFGHGQDTVDIVFPLEQPDDTWGFEILQIELDPETAELQTFGMPTITNKTTGGCTLNFGGYPDHVGYFIKWRIR